MIKNLIIAALLINSTYLTYKVVDEYILAYRYEKAYNESIGELESFVRTIKGKVNTEYTCRLKK